MNKLAEMLAKLASGGVEFVLVGGYAAVAHGVTIVTQDIDVCCRFNKENLFRLQSVLADLHPRHRMTPQKLPLELTDEICARLKNLYLETDLCVLDCLSEVQGVGAFDGNRPEKGDGNGNAELMPTEGSFKLSARFCQTRCRHPVLYLLHAASSHRRRLDGRGVPGVRLLP